MPKLASTRPAYKMLTCIYLCRTLLFFAPYTNFYGINDMILCKRLVDDTVIPHIVMGNFKETIFHQRELVAGKHYFYIRCFKKGGGCFIEVYDYSGHSIARYELDILLYTFDVDEANRTIYGYNGAVFEDGFLMYNY